jgi:hypothetical protein
MYSSYDDPDYRPAPGQRERQQVKFLELRKARLMSEIAKIDDEVDQLKNSPNFFDTPLPL